MATIDGTTFTAKVVELEIEARKKFIDLRQTVHDRTAELKGDEEALKLPSITVGAAEAMPVTDANFDSTDTINDQITLTLDSDFGKPIVVSHSAQAETPVALLETYAKNAEIAHRTNRNAVILAAIAAAADTSNQHYKYADSVDDVISAADILAAAAVLDNAGAPDEGRYMAISATDYSNLFNIDNFISRDKMGANGETIPTNVIGMVHGFTVLKVPTSEMPKINASTGAVDSSTGKTSALFWQQYAVCYGQHIYDLIGPELKAGAAAEWYNLHHKFGVDTQVSTFAVSYRKNA
jgi:hypothetical protein